MPPGLTYTCTAMTTSTRILLTLTKSISSSSSSSSSSTLQLGFSGLKRVTSRSFFGNTSENFAMDNVDCR